MVWVGGEGILLADVSVRTIGVETAATVAEDDWAKEEVEMDEDVDDDEDEDDDEDDDDDIRYCPRLTARC